MWLSFSCDQGRKISISCNSVISGEKLYFLTNFCPFLKKDQNIPLSLFFSSPSSGHLCTPLFCHLCTFLYLSSPAIIVDHDDNWEKKTYLHFLSKSFGFVPTLTKVGTTNFQTIVSSNARAHYHRRGLQNDAISLLCISI